MGDARALASVIGEDELSPIDKNIWSSAGNLKNSSSDRDRFENRTIEQTLEKDGNCWAFLPAKNLTVSIQKVLDQYYHPIEVDLAAKAKAEAKQMTE